jgi:hypothetical protein
LPYRADFDFTAFFDQFELSELARTYHVVRYQILEPDGSTTMRLMQLTRLPMGAAEAPGIAQQLTSIIVEPIIKLLAQSGGKVFTMIDNIRIACSDKVTYEKAINMLLARCAAVGVTLNDMEWPDGRKSDPFNMSLDEWCEYGLCDGKIFLGECYTAATVSNAPKNVEKLAAAHARFTAFADAGGCSRPDGASTDTYTHRHVISLIALAFWMMNTLDIHLAEQHELLQSYARLSQRAFHHGWDKPLTFIDERLRRKVDTLVNRLKINQPVALPEEPREPSSSCDDYELVITVDASALGWAALVYIVATGRCICLQSGWGSSRGRFALSTIAEPTAALQALAWVHTHLSPSAPSSERPYPIALITDHAPIATGQARWYNHHGGFSGNLPLNNLYQRMRLEGVQAWHVCGQENLADGPSRSPPSGCHIVATEVHGLRALPVPLSTLTHPFVGREGVVDDRRMQG